MCTKRGLYFLSNLWRCLKCQINSLILIEMKTNVYTHMNYHTSCQKMTYLYEEFFDIAIDNRHRTENTILLTNQNCVNFPSYITYHHCARKLISLASLERIVMRLFRRSLSFELNRFSWIVFFGVKFGTGKHNCNSHQGYEQGVPTVDNFIDANKNNEWYTEWNYMFER